jgi:opacity protein-like surface antigen
MVNFPFPATHQRMKKLIFLLPVILVTVASAQPVRLHLGGGFSNYYGDLQNKRFTLQQASGVVSAGGTFNLTDKFSLRSDYSFSRVGADDSRSSELALRKRNLNFKTLIRELSLMAEYDLFDLSQRAWTPYLFAGIGVFKFSPYTFDSVNRKAYLQGLGTEGQGLAEFRDRTPYNQTQLNIPFGGGVKYALSDDVHLSLELSARKLFTDYLDDVSSTYVDENVLLAGRGPRTAELAFRGDEVKTDPLPYPAAGTFRGNPKYNDGYYFAQLRISFRMNWFDNGGSGNGGRRSKVGCPTRIL